MDREHDKLDVLGKIPSPYSLGPLGHDFSYSTSESSVEDT